MTNKEKRDVYAEIQEKILAALDRGIVPWIQPWADDPTTRMRPRNFDGRAYRGINTWILQAVEGPAVFLTYRKAQSLGGHVKRGEKSSTAVFWKVFVRDPENEEEAAEASLTEDGKIRRFMLRAFAVFSLSQTEGIEDPKWLRDLRAKAKSRTEPERIQAAEEIFGGFFAASGAPSLGFGGNSAFYSPARDLVQLPERKQFTSAGAFYGTAFHEIGHSTGHAKRLNREEIGSASFGSDPYAREELVAEMTAAFLLGAAGIADERLIVQSASYIDGWRRKISEDKRLVTTAAQRAQKAADFILKAAGVSEETEESEEAEAAA